MNKGFRRRVARAIIIDRAKRGGISIIGYVARVRAEENYRFASRFVAGKAVLDVGGGVGIGHDLLLASGAASILSLDRYIAPVAQTDNARLRYIQDDFVTCTLPESHFDVVICLGTLLYLSDADGALAKMHRLLKPGGALVINSINRRLVRRYFGIPVEEIDGKFSTAYDEAGFRAVLKKHFDTDPILYVQQPVPASGELPGVLRFWLTPLTWPLRRQAVLPRPPGMDGMFLYAIVNKNG